MKKILLNIIVAAGLLGSVSAWAGKSDQVIVQEAQKNIVSVAQIAKLQDETGVTLNGQIVSHSKDDYYLLKDATGTIQLEIDDDLWRDAKLKVGDHVRVVGEVDTHRYKPTDIEVIKIEKHSH